jgi:hypothetical protein
MFLILPTLLIAGATYAQMTTSIFLLKGTLGTDKIGFYGSVIGASNGHTTLAISYDNGTNIDALNLGQINQTVTVSPTGFESGQDLSSRDNEDPDAIDLLLRCDIASAPSNDPASCTYSYVPYLARRINCERRSARTSTFLRTYTHTYSGRGTYSAGVETFVRSLVFGGANTRSTASWCSDSSYLPESGYITTFTMERESIGAYQVVITAGLEKLSATQGVAVSSSSATPTASGGGAGGSTGAAVPMKTMGPVYAGLGAAAAMFL